MRRGDWESAKRSIEETFGRSSREHRQTLDTLSAAIHYKSVLGRRVDSRKADERHFEATAEHSLKDAMS
jgi:hypothetical protein